jgi:hypothetical protein
VERSIRPATLKRMPKSETTVTVATLAVVVAAHNLAIGVIVEPALGSASSVTSSASR